MINNNDIPLSGDGVICLNVLIFFIDNSDEFESNIVLKADSEISKEKQTFLNDFNVGLEDKVFLNS